MHGADSVSVQGGRYESTNSGRYFVDKRPGVVLPPLTAAQVANPAQHGLATRHYVVSQYVRHPNLSSIQYSNFFNLVPYQEPRFLVLFALPLTGASVLGAVPHEGDLLRSAGEERHGLQPR